MSHFFRFSFVSWSGVCYLFEMDCYGNIVILDLLFFPDLTVSLRQTHTTSFPKVTLMTGREKNEISGRCKMCSGVLLYSLKSTQKGKAC